ncbi:MAG: SsrA-binding protein SmpB [Patescibacteria group bacterium]
MKHNTGQRFADNRKVRYDYEILEKFDGGLVLSGQEVKAIREGGAKIDGAHVAMSRGELWLLGSHIRPYSKSGSRETHVADRSRKILVHKDELKYLLGKTAIKGLTLMPLALYPSGRQIKLSFALCRGQKAPDKREKLKSRDILREVHRQLRGRDIE